MVSRTEVCGNCKDKNFLIECACGCGRILTYVSSEYYTRNYISGHNSKGDNNPFWRSGVTMHGQGYIMIKKRDHPFSGKNGYIMMHRLVYENEHRCILLPWANVHHHNAKRNDNRVENLEAMMRGRHTTIEMIKRHHHNKVKLVT